MQFLRPFVAASDKRGRHQCLASRLPPPSCYCAGRPRLSPALFSNNWCWLLLCFLARDSPSIIECILGFQISYLIKTRYIFMHVLLLYILLAVHLRTRYQTDLVPMFVTVCRSQLNTNITKLLQVSPKCNTQRVRLFWRTGQQSLRSSRMWRRTICHTRIVPTFRRTLLPLVTVQREVLLKT
jgi:hypothetical protein